MDEQERKFREEYAKRRELEVASARDPIEIEKRRMSVEKEKREKYYFDRIVHAILVLVLYGGLSIYAGIFFSWPVWLLVFICLCSSLEFFIEIRIIRKQETPIITKMIRYLKQTNFGKKCNMQNTEEDYRYFLRILRCIEALLIAIVIILYI